MARPASRLSVRVACPAQNTHNAVEIEFADKAGGRNQRFMDSWNFVMGSLGPTGDLPPSPRSPPPLSSHQSCHREWTPSEGLSAAERDAPQASAEASLRRGDCDVEIL